MKVAIRLTERPLHWDFPCVANFARERCWQKGGVVTQQVPKSRRVHVTCPKKTSRAIGFPAPLSLKPTSLQPRQRRRSSLINIHHYHEHQCQYASDLAFVS